VRREELRPFRLGDALRLDELPFEDFLDPPVLDPPVERRALERVLDPERDPFLVTVVLLPGRLVALLVLGVR